MDTYTEAMHLANGTQAVGRPRGPRKHPEYRHYEVQDIWERQREMIRLMILGWGNQEIASALGVTPQNVSDVRNSPLVKDRLAVLGAARDAATVDIAREIKEEAGASLNLLRDIRDGRVEAGIALRASVARDLLDRAGHSAIRKVQGEIVSTHLTRDDLEALKQRARDAATQQGLMVAAEVIQ